VLKSGYLNAADHGVVQEAVKRLWTAEPELHALLGQMNDADLIRKLLELIGGIAGAAYVIGAHGAMTDTARVFLAISGATHMRVRRATSANEQKLRTVIEAVAAANGITIPSGHAYKDAGRILSEVNERLSRSRDKPVSVDAIYRRLRPRSSRTRRN
jgi:DNA-binding transcriptional LysR family regulator